MSEFVLVPREPTEAMLRAATVIVPTWDDASSRRKYLAMIAAAPAPAPTGDSAGKLLPCPFCGCAEIEQKYDNTIRCTNDRCDAEMHWGHFAGPGAKEAMAKAWNTRQPPQPTGDVGEFTEARIVEIANNVMDSPIGTLGITANDLLDDDPAALLSLQIQLALSQVVDRLNSRLERSVSDEIPNAGDLPDKLRALFEPGGEVYAAADKLEELEFSAQHHFAAHHRLGAKWKAAEQALRTAREALRKAGSFFEGGENHGCPTHQIVCAALTKTRNWIVTPT